MKFIVCVFERWFTVDACLHCSGVGTIREAIGCSANGSYSNQLTKVCYDMSGSSATLPTPERSHYPQLVHLRHPERTRAAEFPVLGETTPRLVPHGPHLRGTLLKAITPPHAPNRCSFWQRYSNTPPRISSNSRYLPHRIRPPFATVVAVVYRQSIVSSSSSNNNHKPLASRPTPSYYTVAA